MNYSQKLRDPRWQRKRLEILNRDNFTCRLCNDFQSTLNVHHLKYSGDPWDADEKHLVTLCEHCHLEVEYLKIKIKDFDFNNVYFYKNFTQYPEEWVIFSIYNSDLTQSFYKNGVRIHSYTLDYWNVFSLEILIKKIKVEEEIF